MDIYTMSQRDVLDIIEQNNDWLSVEDISENLGVNKRSVRESLRRLAKGKYIQIQENATKKKGHLYRAKETD
jgi:predicted ArsR family transcriptional regulator